MVLAFTFQLAQSAGWIFAVGWLVFLAVLFGLVLVLDRFLDWGLDRITGWGLRKPLQPATAKTPHWFVRFGWIISMALGFGAVMLFPEPVKSWL